LFVGAAIEADKLGVETTIIYKGKYGASGCTPNSASEWMAYGVALGVANPKDSCEAHFQDIVKTGAYVCDQNLAKIIAYEAPWTWISLTSSPIGFLALKLTYDDKYGESRKHPTTSKHG